MAAGLGYIEFATGDILTAASANGYLASQTVMVFASAAARTSAIASPQEGMVSYLKDTNAVEYYSGSAWTAIGGATGGMTLLSTTTASGSSTSVSITPTGYNEIIVIVKDLTLTADGDLFLRINNDTTASNYNQAYQGVVTNTNYVGALNNVAGVNAIIPTVSGYPTTAGSNIAQFSIPQPNDATRKLITAASSFRASGSVNSASTTVCNYTSTAALSSVQAFTSAGSFNGGTILVYGVK